jgi:DNA-binding NtrC family response regulator
MEVRVKVLIAEDCANSREALAEFFRSQGISVAVAQDGPQARACLQSDIFDAVVVHLNLPRANTSELAQQAWARNPTAAVVVVTAFGDGFQPVARAPRSNVFLVQKPFRAVQLLRLIQEARVQPSNEALSSERIDIVRPLMQYDAHCSEIDT